MAPLDGRLDVLGIDVAAPDDHQVLEPAGDEQLAVRQEAQVAGAEEGPLAGVGQDGAERLRSLLGPVPVAVRDARAGDPDLADPVGAGIGVRRLGIDDRDHLVVGDPAGADQARASASSAVVTRRPGPARSRPPGPREQRARADFGAAGDQQGRLGQPVAGQERLAAEAAGRERLGEAVERLRPDRLGAVEGDRQELRSSAVRCSAVVLRTQRS